MNFSILIGLLASLIVVIYSAAGGIQNSGIFLSGHAAVIVFGGTFAAALVCFPMRHFLNMARVFFRAISGRHRAMLFETIGEVIGISQILQNNGDIRQAIEKIKNPFLKESLILMLESGLSEQDLEEILLTRVEQQNEKYKRDALTFKIIGKFPPAFGLVGTTIGMISLLQGMGKADAFEQVGPAMSLALVATFYGLIFANFFLIPLGENLSQSSEDDLVMRRMVIEGVRLLRERRHPIHVGESLKSYLTPADRQKLEISRAA